MEDDSPKISNRALFIHMVGSLENLHTKIDSAVEQRRRADRHVHLWHILSLCLAWSGKVATQVSTMFIAGYVAVEHTWYVDKLGGWIMQIFHWKP